MLRPTAKTVLAVAALLCGAAAPAASARDLPKASYIVDGAPTFAPMAFVQFCRNYPDQCDAGAPAVIALTPAAWATMTDVDRAVNARIRANPRKDEMNWSLEARSGNCNDYAVQKRDELARRGFPLSALSLAVVLTDEGVGHLVLTVRTDRGDFILDNLKRGVRSWASNNYTWIKRQSSRGTLAWVTVQRGSPTPPPVPAREPIAVAEMQAPIAAQSHEDNRREAR